MAVSITASMDNPPAAITQQPLWLWLHFPQLPLEALLPGLEDEANNDQGKPLAAISATGNPRTVLCCTQAATDCGITPDMPLPTALSLCPTLHSLRRQTEQEQSCLQRLALIAYRFSPSVVLPEAKTATSGLWLNITGCGRLFGGYGELLRQLHYGLAQQGISAVTGFGISPLAAQLGCGDSFALDVPSAQQRAIRLKATPLARLSFYQLLSQKQQRQFDQLGIQRLGDILALPRPALGRRFGSEMLGLIKQISGETPHRATLFQPPAEFHDLLQHPDGIFSKQGLLFPMKVLLQRLCQYLIARQCHCREIIWHFEPLLGERQSMRVQLATSQNTWTMLLTLSRLQLERLELAGSIEKVVLHCDQLIEAPIGEMDLFGDNSRQHDYQLIDKLHARLGATALSQPAVEDEHLPEQAGLLRQNLRLKAVTSKGLSKELLRERSKGVAAARRKPIDQAVDNAGPERPLWLLLKPQPVQQRGQQLYWQEPLTLVRGPERVHGNWWQGQQPQRDYYLACGRRGTRYWLYRDRNSQHWFVQGVFS